MSGISTNNNLTSHFSQTEQIEHQQLSEIDVPRTVILHIFEFLSPKDLCQAFFACREWNVAASDKQLWDLKKLFPSLTVLDEKVWETHADLTALEISLNDTPPLDHRTIIQLERLLTSEKVEERSGATLLTIPKGLTGTNLIQFSMQPKKGTAIRAFRVYGDELVIPKWEIEGVAIRKTHRVIFTYSAVEKNGQTKVFSTNSVAEGSKNLSPTDQQELIDKFGGEWPPFYNLGTLAFLTVISSPESPLNHLFLGSEMGIEIVKK